MVLEIREGEIRDSGIGWLTARFPAIVWTIPACAQGRLTGVKMGDQARDSSPEARSRRRGGSHAGALAMAAAGGFATIAGGRITVVEAASPQVSVRHGGY